MPSQAKTQQAFLIEIDELILKCILTFKRPRKPKTLMKNKNEAEGLSLPHCKTTLIKMVPV